MTTGHQGFSLELNSLRQNSIQSMPLVDDASPEHAVVCPRHPCMRRANFPSIKVISQETDYCVLASSIAFIVMQNLPAQDDME
ncbi:hypothetical protein VNO77_23112 [Canavalia gladiata]|uniref:Uncharacterized protein n=1 Tax=Canavalia gladiata TaxID=3824 RepID=A0AAN9L6E6_CANGL